MNVSELSFLIDRGEGQRVEFKESLSGVSSLARELVDFANDAGGLIVFGVRDSGEVVGFPRFSNKLKSVIQGIARGCDPSIDVFLEEVFFPGNNLLLVRVP